MPHIHFMQQIISCEIGENLRDVLLQNGMHPYNGNAKLINCRGLGTFGTCAVKITGPVSAATAVEKWRLNFPPHQIQNGLRLACQTKILADVVVQKFEGFWGQHVKSK
ncbi:MAG TPA: hypothetical protein PKC24_06760 [Cyclobacteriaceae bacterium]|nr:hypothetical protein [Cyclobacteriaceae bacterium]